MLNLIQRGLSSKAWTVISRGSVELGRAILAMPARAKLVVFSCIVLAPVVFTAHREVAERQEVLQLTQQGISAVDVARQLSIPEEKVETILRKDHLAQQNERIRESQRSTQRRPSYRNESMTPLRSREQIIDDIHYEAYRRDMERMGLDPDMQPEAQVRALNKVLRKNGMW